MERSVKDGPKSETDSLSKLLHRDVDEATQLLEIKAAWGRLPNSSRKSSALTSIELWFDKAFVYCPVTEPTVVPWALIQELWVMYPSQRELYKEYLSEEQVNRLRQGDPPETINPYAGRV